MMDKTELCNLALLTVGDKALTDYNEDNYKGSVVRTFYPIVKERVLREHAWNCATKRQKLAQLTSDPAFGYDFAYQLPTDCIRAIQLNDPAYSFHIEGDRLVTDTSPAYLMYIADVEVAKLDPHVTRCIQYQLASELANTLAQNIKMSQALEEKLQKWILPRAKHLDGVESHGDKFFDGFYDMERRGPHDW